MGPNYSGSHILNDLLTRMKLFNNIPASANGSVGKANGAGKRRQSENRSLEHRAEHDSQIVSRGGFAGAVAAQREREVEFALENGGNRLAAHAALF